MKAARSLVEEYHEYEREVAEWRLQIIAYRLGDKFVCIINNLDPGATICRVCAGDRVEALRSALEQANECLARTATRDVKPLQPAHHKLARIAYRQDDAQVELSVADFLGLPIQTRMNYILSGDLAYLAEDGSRIPAALAMKLLGESPSTGDDGARAAEAS